MEWDGSVGYEYASRAGNPPHVPFKFNFDEDAIRFDWEKITYPECDVCERRVDTMMENFVRCPGQGLFAGLQCEECATAGKRPCCCTPKMHVINSLEKY